MSDPLISTALRTLLDAASRDYLMGAAFAQPLFDAGKLQGGKADAVVTPRGSRPGDVAATASFSPGGVQRPLDAWTPNGPPKGVVAWTPRGDKENKPNYFNGRGDRI